MHHQTQPAVGPRTVEFADLLAANTEFAASFAYGGYDGIARAGIGIVTCMDSRIAPLAMVGLKPGDAKVLRSPGGRVTEPAMTGLVLAVQLLGVRRILIVPHTRCAVAGITEDQLRQRIDRAAGWPTADLLRLDAIPDQTDALRSDVRAVRENPLIGKKAAVAGFLYDVDTGRLRLQS
ncbi:beta-class carbonic anhydrase [Kribbella shirazensis]|uniref:carbonic anhydrase n=1 Tax=Kribbella shirazensis TaxID=1105143 RepID=A0A7X5VIJ1_9ACTN|nr:carbonic anhydrase [Kribbella shirazensis]NIK61456.1 carbonic anhydrase [Kribbella shirazensis]